MKYAVILFLLIIIAGCAKQPPTQQTATQQPDKTNGTVQTQNQQAVSISNFAFDPSQTTVKAGTTVTWTNNDTAPHKVVEEGDMPGFSSENMARGTTYGFTFDAPGTFNYYCQIHPSMKGTITVTP